jgi:hypothetical protein
VLCSCSPCEWLINKFFDRCHKFATRNFICSKLQSTNRDLFAEACHLLKSAFAPRNVLSAKNATFLNLSLFCVYVGIKLDTVCSHTGVPIIMRSIVRIILAFWITIFFKEHFFSSWHNPKFHAYRRYQNFFFRVIKVVRNSSSNFLRCSCSRAKHDERLYKSKNDVVIYIRLALWSVV